MEWRQLPHTACLLLFPATPIESVDHAHCFCLWFPPCPQLPRFLLPSPAELLSGVDYAHRPLVFLTHCSLDHISPFHGHCSRQGHRDLLWFTWWPHLSPQRPRLWALARALTGTSASFSGRFPFLCWSTRRFCFSGLYHGSLLFSDHTLSGGLIHCHRFRVLRSTHHPQTPSPIENTQG